jgi:esterase
VGRGGPGAGQTGPGDSLRPAWLHPQPATSPYDTITVAEHTDDAAALLDALGAAPAAVVGRSYGGGIGIDLALRYRQRVRALVLLEAAILSLSAGAIALEEALRQRVLAAAAEDVTTVGETLIRFILGDATWDGFSVPIKQMFTNNGPAAVAEVNGGFLQVDRAALATIDRRAHAAGYCCPLPRGLPAGHPRDGHRDAQQPQAHGRGGHLINPADPVVLSFLQELPP